MSSFKRSAYLCFFVLLIALNFWILIFSNEPWFINSLNILFHEAGHVIFSLFGHFVMVLGGFLGQTIIPLIFILYFRAHQNIEGRIFSWWWLSVSLHNSSIYIADARARLLPLIGGQHGHDWVYLLGEMNILELDLVIARFFQLCMLLITVYLIKLCFDFRRIIFVEK